ncbi:MAG: tyrosine-type recombinase/integrase [Legionellaceae bacterium]|nr:tyrosine-type recombinase/integrase [Legionellaceae bacterium]
MSNLKTMKQRVQEYLSYRRSLGFKLLVEGQQLLRFAEFVDNKNHCGPVTAEIAIEWSQSSKKPSRFTWARRLEIVTCFAKYCSSIEPGTQIPPKGLFGKSHRRVAPYIFTTIEIQQIVDATKHLLPKNSLRQITFRYLFTLLYVTGLRISEALNLSCDDVDIQNRIIHIKQTKFNKSRLAPIDSSTAIALFNYSNQRERHVSTSTLRAFFVLDNGEPIKLRTAQYAFSKIRRLLNMGSNLQGRVPRIYDLRHTFVCHRILAWYEQKIDVQQNLPYLSTYLGHVKVSDTYWYITGIPELINIASALFNDNPFLKEQPL